MKKNIIMSIMLLGASLSLAQNLSLAVAEGQDYIFIGVDNRIQFSDPNVKQADIVVSCNAVAGATITANDNNYDVRVTSLAEGSELCSISFKNKKTGVLLKKMDFQVRRIPNPVVCLSNKRSDGIISSGEMKIQQGLFVIMGDLFIKDCCSVQNFTLTFTGPGQNPVTFENNGAKFEDGALRLIQLARPGAIYQFSNVRGRCPGDSVSRQMNGMSFTVR